MGLSFCCLAAADGKKLSILLTIIPILFQKTNFLFGILITPLPFTSRFRPIPFVGDYNPTYIDQDYGKRSLLGHKNSTKQDLLQFQYVLDDIDHYNKDSSQEPSNYP